MKGPVVSCFVLMLLFAGSVPWAADGKAVEDTPLEQPDPIAELERLERLLSDQDDIEKLKVIMGMGDSLKIKLYYKSGVRAMYKPDHHKWRYKVKTRSATVTRPRQPELAVYRFAKSLLPSVKVVYPPVVQLEFSPEQLLELAFDDPDTKRDEVEYLRLALGEGRSRMPTVAFPRGKDVVVGSATLWVKGKKMAHGLISALSREKLLEIVEKVHFRHRRYLPKTLFHQFVNMLVIDMLVVNNDRVANVLYDVDGDRVNPIDNDDAFVAGRRKGYCKNLVRALRVYDPVLFEKLKQVFEENDNGAMADTFLASYPRARGLKYASEMRRRFERILVRVVKRQKPIRTVDDSSPR